MTAIASMRKAGALVALAAMAVLSGAAVACDLERPSGVPPCTRAAVDALPMGAIQSIGTHNSYKQAMAPDELAAHRKVDAAGADGLDYAHPPLREQLDLGVRALELDIYHDPQGGRYLSPPGAHRSGYAAPPWSREDLARMREPGFKVMHLHDIDFRSHCVTLGQCLEQLRDWSRAHPWHAPIMVSVNAKDSGGGPGAVSPLPFDAGAFDALDAQIRGVFPASQLLQPDDVQGDHDSLRDAVRTRGWPTLGEARGKVFFVLDETPRKIAIHQSRIDASTKPAMFVATDEGDDAAAFLVLNDPVAQRTRIANAVKAGFLVRTRSDADTREARVVDTRRREAAFASGAQFISTDYPQPDARWPSYRVVFSDGRYVRCNPAHPACASLLDR